jgi:hypothetical protein
MAKINERILNEKDLEQKQEEEQQEKQNTKRVPSMQEYGEIRIPKTWTKPPALIDLKHDIEGAIDEHDLIIEDINDYLDFYHTTPGKGRPVKIKGRSNAQPQSIRKAAEWRYATLSEPFLDSPNLFKGEPTTGFDIQGSKQTELMLNHQFRNQIGLVDFVDDYIKDLVDIGTAIIRTSWEMQEISREIEQDVVKYVDAPELGDTYSELISLMREDPELFRRNHEPEIAAAIKMSIEEGRPLRREVIKTEKVTIIETVKNQPKLEICDYRDVIPDPTCRGIQEDMQFCGFRIRTTKAALNKDPRYFNVDDITPAAVSVIRQDALDTFSEDMDQDSDTFQFKDPNRQPIEGIEYWGFVDVDDSGILTPVVFTWFGDVLVRAEENPYPDKKIPFTFVSYLKKRNSLYGEPDGVLLHEDQKISGAITRGVIDILAKNANGQRGIPKGALDYSNLMLYREGKDYEFNPTAQIGRDGITQVTKFPEIPQSAIAIQQLAEQNIKELTGTVMGTGSTNQGSNIGTQPSQAQVAGMSKAARRELGILRRIADGIIEVGHKICAMNMEFLDDEEVVRVTDNEFEVIQKDNLDCRYDLSLSISTAEDDSVKAQELAFMLQTSTGIMDQAFVRELLADIADLRRMPDKAEKYRRFQPQPDPLQEEIKKLEIAKLQAEVEEIQSRTQENQAEAQREAANAQKMLAEAELAKAKADAVNLKYLEDDSGLSHERDLEKQQAQAEGNIRLEKAKKDLEARNDTLVPETPNTANNLTNRENIGTNDLAQENARLDTLTPEQLFDELDDLGNTDDVLTEE